MREEQQSGSERWSFFRFSVIGPLLASPPAKGELQSALKALAAQPWRHPISGERSSFGASTLERWYYKALNEKKNPVEALGTKIRCDAGTHPSVSRVLHEEIDSQYRTYPEWSYQLHADNLVAWAKQDAPRPFVPSATTLRRYMQSMGWYKRKHRGGRNRTAGTAAAEARFENLEVRSYEAEQVNALWHLDFHTGSLMVLDQYGERRVPELLGVLDDRSRLCCHLQWYLHETAEVLVHGFCQALQKRGLPRALMSDNGSAMISTEFTQGLKRLSISHETTLPYSPYQNGKQEKFWGQVEGRLLAMLVGKKDLSLSELNLATQAWVEMEYNRKIHSEINQTPLSCYISEDDLGRACPSSQTLTQAFTATQKRTQRRTDGTISIRSKRFEIPSRYRHIKRISLRYAPWDLSKVFLGDEHTGKILCQIYPLDKHKNAEGRRRPRGPVAGTPDTPAPVAQEGTPALLAELIAQYAATGLPPAYIPKDETKNQNKEQDHE